MVLENFSNRLQAYKRKMYAFTLRKQAMLRPFSDSTSQRLLLVTQPERIPQSQIYPFHFYKKELRRDYNLELREENMEDVLAGNPVVATGATVVAFQTPFNISDSDLYKLVNRLRDLNPGARMVYLDWFSPLDLRNADRMGTFIDYYIKKHVFRDRDRYGQATQGDTNLTDYYGQRIGLTDPMVQHSIPAGFLEKLIVGPSFLTAPCIMPDLLKERSFASDRPIDLHARFATQGTPWYCAMRNDAKAALALVSDLSVVHEGTISLHKFLLEMRHSKLCFSPFGYGEVCWRDYEAIMTGAVLVKPDMSHVETDPNIFIPWETYVPLRWDLSDFEETVRRLCADQNLRERIADNAFSILQNWLKSNNFSKKLIPIFKK